MLDSQDTIECLELAKQRVSRLAWALSLHVSSGIGGGAWEVERNAEQINGWIDVAIDRIRADNDAHVEP